MADNILRTSEEVRARIRELALPVLRELGTETTTVADVLVLGVYERSLRFAAVVIFEIEVEGKTYVFPYRENYALSLLGEELDIS